MPEIVQGGQSRIGFKTQVTTAELEAALVRLFKPKGNNVPQTAVFYFSGHGLQKDAGVQEGFLATSDVNPSAGFYGLSLFWLRRLLQESPVRQRIILLDCCHSGELLNFLEADPGARSGTDRLFMAASREYEAAYESMIGKYSVFTQALIDGLDPSRMASSVITNYALTDWVSNALKAEMQQPLFENSGSEIVLTRGQSVASIVKTELAQDICPYRGLEFFDEVHAEYFFGREDLTDQLIEQLRTGNFVAVVGSSGSGKSSLVRAGLIHSLRQGRKLSGSDRWRIQLISPTDQPLKSLATAFVNPKDSAIERAEQLRRAEHLLQDGGKGLSHLVRASLMSAKHGRNSRLLLIIDQFEEIFTLCRGVQAERDRHSFFNCLTTALREIGDCLSIVVVLRADFFGKYSLYSGLAEQIEQHLVTVTPLTYQQIKASIIKPAEKAGIVCEQNLVYNILLDVVGAPGELPLLQYTLLELWQRRQANPDGGPARLTLDAYNELGGVRGTLQKRANEIFYSLTPDEQRVAKRIFIALTQIGDGTEDTRRRILKSELISPWFPADLVERVLEKLVTAKLVVTNRINASSHVRKQAVQGFANVSTALRLSQMRRGKLAQATPESAIDLTSDLEDSTNSNIADITHLSIHHLADLPSAQQTSNYDQETVDVAHEALIRNWSLLRTWLDENRELLQRQRRIEQTARDWYAMQQPQSPEYLLHGDRLIDAEDYLIAYPDELSALAQRYIAVSREENRRAYKERRLLQLSVPCTLLIALIVTFSQYRSIVKSQAEKEYQLQIATSRQQAAVAQSILQEPDGDPTAALLISRLAAEKSGYTYEAQASLRSALQKLRLQTSFQGHQGAVHQVVFSPDERLLATAGEDGTIRLWSLETQTLERVLSWREESGSQSAQALPSQAASTTSAIVAISFSPDGKQLAAIAKHSSEVQVWSVTSGKRMLKLSGLQQPVQQLAFSPNGDWIAASADNIVQIWDADVGQLRASLRHLAPVNSLAFSPNNRDLLTASGDTAQLWQMSNWQRHKLLRHSKRVNSAAFSPNGQMIATACDDGVARLWQVTTGQLHHAFTASNSLSLQGSKQLQTFGRPSPPLTHAFFSPDGQFVATFDASHVWLWKAESGQLWSQLDHSDASTNDNRAGQTTVAFSPDNQRLVTTDHNLGDERSLDAARLWDVQTGQLMGSLRGHLGAIEAVQFSRNGSLIATASADGSARLWATERGSEFPTLKMMTGQIQWAAFRRLTQMQPIGASSNKTAAAIAPFSFLTGQAPKPASLTLANAFSEIVTVAIDGTMHTWNPTKPSIVGNTSKALGIDPAAVSWSPARLTGIKAFNFLRFFGAFNKAAAPLPSTIDLTAAEMTANPKVLANLAVSAVPSTKVNAVLTANTVPQVVQPQATSVAATAMTGLSDRLVGKLPTDAKLTAVTFSVDTRLMATANANGQVEIWQMKPEQLPQRLRQLEFASVTEQSSSFEKESSRQVHQLAFSPNGQTLLSVGDNRVMSLWDVSSGKLRQQLQGHDATIEAAQFSEDGQRIVSASRDRTVRVWHAASGQLIITLHHHDVVSSAHFSPDGQQIVTASWDGAARIFDAATGELRVVLAGHRGAVLDAEFSPDAATLVTASTDGTVRLWDAKTGTEQALLRSGEPGATQEQIQHAFFSPDGRYVATLSKSGQLRLWAATWEELLDLARDRSLRQLEPDECLRYLRLSPNTCPALGMKQ